MARCSDCHKKLVDGIGKCSVPMWCNELPAGFCDKPAYGRPTKEGRLRFKGYVPSLACFDHGGPTTEDKS